MENKIERKKYTKIIILILIILMILMFWLGYRIGRIGYKETVAGINNEEENTTVLEIIENDMYGIKDNQLNIFKNQEFNYRKIIAPRSKGTYKFAIKNKTENDLIYNISFDDEENKLINMKYKLKFENVYMKGDKEKYVPIEEINMNDIIIMKNSIQLYTLEWCWEDNDKVDTVIGSMSENQYYQLNVKIQSNEI